MKINLLPILFSTLMITTYYGCKNHNPNDTNTAIRKEISLENISNYNVSGFSAVSFIKSDSNKMVITGTETRVSQVNSKIENNSISVGMKNSDDSYSDISIAIYTTNISSIQVNANGNVTIGDLLNAQKASLDANACGNLNVTMNVDTINCTVNAVANATLTGHIHQGDLAISAVAHLNTESLKKDDVKVSTSAIASGM